MKMFFVYVLTNRYHTVYYTGMTNNLLRRIHEHKTKVNNGFSAKYNIDKLIYYEAYDNPTDAISREKQIKKYSRKKKIMLIERMNSRWLDLNSEGDLSPPVGGSR